MPKGTVAYKNKKSELNILLQDTPETYYWMGFLIADGHFSENGSIDLQLSTKDKEHMIKYANFIQGNIRIYNQRITVAVTDLEVRNTICEKFNLNNRKTYYCPTLPMLTDEQFISLFIGLIDGDGSIVKDGRRMKIKIHFSWYDFLCQISDRLKNITTNDSIYVNYEKYTDTHILGVLIKKPSNKFSVLSINKKQILHFLKNKTSEFGLPIMERKWDRIKTS